MENFILHIRQRLGVTGNAEELSHLENDLAHIHLYLENYREKEPYSAHDIFVQGGSLSRSLSNRISVLRPKSEVFRMALLHEKGRLEKSSKIAENDKNKGKADLLLSHVKILENMIKSVFDSPSPQGENRSV
jgi:hypothetical protein